MGRNPIVEAYMQELDNQLKDIWEQIRSAVLSVDPEGVLEGDAREARVFRVASGEELNARRADLQKVVQSWIRLRDQ